jgi:hypothetical protein
MRTLIAALAFSAVAGWAASAAQAASPATISSLAGPWAASLVGSTACGLSTLYTKFTLNSAGTGEATTTYHTASCGDTTSTFPFSVTALNAAGAGTAHLSCGSDCGWDFQIQVLPGNKLFSLVDVSPGNPHNYLEGTAIYQ